MPLLSIITVCFNDLGNLKKTFTSIHNKIGDDIEWVVVDGDSKDKTCEYLDSLESVHGRLNFRYLSEKDKGIYDAMNKGVSMAKGDYFIFLNAGDELLVDNMHSWFSIICRNDFDVLYGGADLVFPDDSIVYRPPRVVAKYIWHGLPANHQATIYKSSVFNNLKYNSNLSICGDYELAADISKEYSNFYYVDLAIVRFHIGGVSFMNPITSILESIDVQRRVLKLNWLVVAVSVIKRIISLVVVEIIFFYKSTINKYA